jgi:hypothetical protein
MKARLATPILSLALALGTGTPVLAEEGSGARPANDAPEGKAPAAQPAGAPAAAAPSATPGAPAAAGAPDVAMGVPLYQLPKVGKPRERIGGGRRGIAQEQPEVLALVPDHVGLTVNPQPVLYWYLSGDARGSARFELTLIDEDSVDPLIDAGLAGPVEPGLQRIDLAAYGIELAPDREYQWFVSLSPDAEQRSKDLVSSGWIQRVAKPADLAARLAGADADGARAAYGEAGLWYDVLDASARLAAQHPEDPRYRRQLAQLLEQAGLPAAAAGDPSRAPQAAGAR